MDFKAENLENPVIGKKIPSIFDEISKALESRPMVSTDTMELPIPEVKNEG
jgi:hypothetical protein